MEATERNLELVREIFEAFTRRDLEAVLQIIDPEIEFYAPTAEIAREGRPYKGLLGIRSYFLDVARIWKELLVIPQDFRAVGDQVLVSGRVYARGDSVPLVDVPTHWVWRVRDGKISWGRVYEDRGEALAAVGLEE
jgi:ketosteroid isomerase-like protein